MVLTQERGVRELELVVLGRLKSVVGAGLRDLLHKRLEVALVATELEAVEVKNVGDGVVEEARVVRDDDRRAVGETGEIALEPCYVDETRGTRENCSEVRVQVKA